MSGFGDYAFEYKKRGWHPIPLPHGRKGPPPTGYTGTNGRNASGPDIQAWIEDGHADGNIGLRITDNVVGIDVDDYDGKGGGQTLAELETELGPLPATWRSSSRPGDPVSGIRFFRVPASEGRYCQGYKGIEVIQHHHRYAVVAPSQHEAGGIYAWYDLSGQQAPGGAIPEVSDLGALPPAWTAHLEAGASSQSPITAPDGAPVALTGGPMDVPVVSALAEAIEATQGESGSRHAATRDQVALIVRLGEQGYGGTDRALATLKAVYVAAVGSSRAGAAEEFDRMVSGACDLVGKTPSDEYNTVAGAVAVSGMLDAIESPPAVEPSTKPLRRRFLTLDELWARPRPKPLIEGLLYQNTLAQLYGAPGTFKSFAALGMACAVASGQSTWESHPIHRNGPVLYVAAEGESGLRNRIEAWTSTTIDSDPGAQSLLKQNMRVMAEVVSLTDEIAMAEVTAEALELQPVLIVLDTRARMTTGLDENSARDQGVAIEQAELLRKATGAVLLVIHHSGKSGTSARGSNSWDGAVNTNLVLERVGKSMNLKIVCEKHKDAPDGCEHKFVMKPVDLPRIEPDEERTSLVMTNGRFDLESMFAETEESIDGKDLLHTVLRENGTVDGFTRNDSWKWFQEDRKARNREGDIPDITTHNRWFKALIAEGKFAERRAKQGRFAVFDLKP